MVESLIALRFSKPLLVESINAKNLVLTGPQGKVAAKVVPAEEGRLADAVNLASQSADHMTSVKFTFRDADHFEQECGRQAPKEKNAPAALVFTRSSGGCGAIQISKR